MIRRPGRPCLPQSLDVHGHHGLRLGLSAPRTPRNPCSVGSRRACGPLPLKDGQAPPPPVARRRLTVHALDVALASPFRIAYDTVTHVANGLAVAETDGVRGFGEASPVAAITR